MPTIASEDHRLLLALRDFTARGLGGDLKLAHLRFYNRLDVGKAEALSGQPRSYSDILVPICSELNHLFQHLRGGTRSVEQIEAIARLSAKDIQQRFSDPKPAGVNGNGLVVP